MTEEEMTLYLAVYTATVQGIHAHGKVYARGYAAADYHPSTSYNAFEQLEMVGSAAAKQAKDAVEHLRKIKKVEAK
jgi:hypothetical protein